MIDWDDAFDNSSYHEGASALAEDWATQSQTTRNEFYCETDLHYGGGARETFDVFTPSDTPKGTVVFIHGGYWHLFDKSFWSWTAKGAYDANYRFVVLNYPLAPEVTIAEITATIANAVNVIAAHFQGDIRICGHSAGGHLTARMACEGVLPRETLARIVKFVPISGIYDLTPLLATKMNETLRLTEEMAERESPVYNQPAIKTPMTLWVGARERPEFLRQTRVCGEVWQHEGANITEIYEPYKNHFTVIDDLARHRSALCRAIFESGRSNVSE